MKITNAEFEKELSSLLNRFSIDSELSRPDFLIAQLLISHLSSLKDMQDQYDKWSGNGPKEVEQSQPTIIIPGNLECGLPSANVVLFETPPAPKPTSYQNAPPVNQDNFNKAKVEKTWSGHHLKELQQLEIKAKEARLRMQQAANAAAALQQQQWSDSVFYRPDDILGTTKSLWDALNGRKK